MVTTEIGPARQNGTAPNGFAQPENETKLKASHLKGNSSPSELPQVVTQKEVFIWTAAGFITFTIAWWYTNGGYICSIPLFIALAAYTYGQQIFSIRFCIHVLMNLKLNLVALFCSEKRSFILMLAYWFLKVLLTIFYPKGENSNGSPVSLIMFTVLFITVFIAPTVLYSIASKSKELLSFLKSFGRCNVPQSRPKSWYIESKYLLCVLHKWRKSVSIMLCLVIGIYIVDGDITSIVRYIGKGSPCWPLLVPRSKRDSLPYPLQHAWIKTWYWLFKDYKPNLIITTITLYGRELGEVCHLLPMLIGVYILSQLFLPRAYCSINKVLFGCIAGVVLGGVTSGSFKILFHRYRPNAYGNPYMWKGPGTATVNHWSFSKLDLSFPAGHTTVTCAVATCLYQALARKSNSIVLSMWLLLCLYFYPIAVLVSRVSDCYHWTSDAVFGIVLGYIVGRVITSRIREHERSEQSQHQQVNNRVLPM